jgi:hypothetical protein
VHSVRREAREDLAETLQLKDRFWNPRIHLPFAIARQESFVESWFIHPADGEQDKPKWIQDPRHRVWPIIASIEPSREEPLERPWACSQCEIMALLCLYDAAISTCSE